MTIIHRLEYLKFEWEMQDLLVKKRLLLTLLQMKKNALKLDYLRVQRLLREQQTKIRYRFVQKWKNLCLSTRVIIYILVFSFCVYLPILLNFTQNTQISSLLKTILINNLFKTANYQQFCRKINNSQKLNI